MKASKLPKGEHLKTDDGQDATSDGGSVPADHDGWMWDLTIQDDHDFYVQPAGEGGDGQYYYVDRDGVTAVLVHNVNGQMCEIGPAPTATELRNSPGAANGGYSLSEGGAGWLRGSHGNFGRIPGQIADQLRGQTFNNFNDFRGAFWKAVGNDPDLSSSFTPQNVSRMLEGNAPRVVSSQATPGQYSYILHHVTPIWAGGGVYDLGNIAVVTPQLHAAMLDPEYHYGG